MKRVKLEIEEESTDDEAGDEDEQRRRRLQPPRRTGYSFERQIVKRRSKRARLLVNFNFETSKF